MQIISNIYCDDNLMNRMIMEEMRNQDQLEGSCVDPDELDGSDTLTASYIDRIRIGQIFLNIILDRY